MSLLYLPGDEFGPTFLYELHRYISYTFIRCVLASKMCRRKRNRLTFMLDGKNERRKASEACCRKKASVFMFNKCQN